MELVTNSSSGVTGQVAPTVSARGQNAPKLLTATATFLLSEEGRKASLLSGGDGRAVQTVTIEVPANRLHLVSVDRQGAARLRLRPRFEVDSDERVTRVDSAPSFDAPPSADELLRLAARNHELEQTYHSARTAAASTRNDAQRELRERIAQAFLADPSQRAVAHPPPTQRRCCLQAESRRIVFDVAEDAILAKGVAVEATRRFRDDQRVKREQNLQERAKQLALHEEKKRYLAEWIAANGTPDQQARQAAGVLPMLEAVAAIAKQAFAPVAAFPPYVHDGADRLREVIVRETAKEAVVLAANDLRVNTEPATTATTAQWALVLLVRERVPDADVTLLRHHISLVSAPRTPSVAVPTVLATIRRGPLVLRREMVAPED